MTDNNKLTASQRAIIEKMIAEAYPKGDLEILVTEAIAVLEESPVYSKPAKLFFEKLQNIELGIVMH